MIPHTIPRRARAFAILALAAFAKVMPAWAAERAIDKQVDVPATADEVWSAWTTREGIRSFFAPDASIDPRVGGAFQIHFDPGAPEGSRGADDMRFLALQPKRMLTFDWNAPPTLPEARTQRTFVIVRLVPLTERSTRVTLHHTGWGEGGDWDKAYGYFDRAWGNVLANLRRRFEHGPLDWKPWLDQLERARAAAPAASSTTAEPPRPAASR